MSPATLLSSFTVDTAALLTQTAASNRTPIYKVDFSVRYPKKAAPNFAAVSDPSVYSLAFTVPAFPIALIGPGIAAFQIHNYTAGGTAWNDLPSL